MSIDPQNAANGGRSLRCGCRCFLEPGEQRRHLLIEAPAFVREGDRIYRTYLINSRGDEAMGSTWAYLDITALGRQEEWEDSPEGYPQTAPYGWWNYHDAYGKEA